ncbi:MAG: hypothetical protein KME12_15765 [Trichocoleus desertorum ATA4-8-CV12]|nr:hypothetical protein [Trichocoleus desertorum ATA4-8-CV12]
MIVFFSGLGILQTSSAIAIYASLIDSCLLIKGRGGEKNETTSGDRSTSNQVGLSTGDFV